MTCTEQVIISCCMKKDFANLLHSLIDACPLSCGTIMIMGDGSSIFGFLYMFVIYSISVIVYTMCSK